MRFTPTHRSFTAEQPAPMAARAPGLRRRGAAPAAGFTLAEVLAALLFMAIVIPVTIQAVRVASQAGTLSDRKAAAAQVADRVLNEILVSNPNPDANQSGEVQEGPLLYRWTSSVEPWDQDALSLLTVQVRFQVQNEEFDVALSTLFDPTAQQTLAAPAVVP